MTTLRIPARFRGPTESANGGYLCGLIAAAAGRPVVVRLLKPTPLETDLVLRPSGDGGLELVHGSVVLAHARPGGVGALEPPPAPSLAAATAAAERYAGFARHPAPSCFVCGPERAAGDALRIFAGPLEPKPGADPAAPQTVAAPWTPDASLAGEDGTVRPEIVWAALDCPGFAAAAPDMRPMLLGELAAEITAAPRAGEPCIVVGWPLGASGRKHEAGTALYAAGGRLLARARALWIEPKP